MSVQEVCTSGDFPGINALVAETDAFKARARDAAKEFFGRRMGKRMGGTFAGLEFDEDLDDYVLFITDDTTVGQVRKAELEIYDHTGGHVNIELMYVPKIWLEEEKFEASGQKCNWWPAVKEIFESKTNRRIHRITGELIPESKRGGVMVDLFTASMLYHIYTNVNAANQLKFRSLSITRVVTVGWKLCK